MRERECVWERVGEGESVLEKERSCVRDCGRDSVGERVWESVSVWERE